MQKRPEYIIGLQELSNYTGINTFAIKSDRPEDFSQTVFLFDL